jgi:hypothetical protein
MAGFRDFARGLRLSLGKEKAGNQSQLMTKVMHCFNSIPIYVIRLSNPH